MDLATFLLARLDEDEAAARAAEHSPPMALMLGRRIGKNSMQAHITRHDPASVLRDVEAKRMIVFDWLAAVRRTDDDGRPEHLTNPTLSMIIKSHYRWLCWLAKPYDQHPDYKIEWKP